MRYLFTFLSVLIFTAVKSQPSELPGEISARWADSVYATLTPDQRIAQLMVVRLSSLDAKNNKVIFYDQFVKSLIEKYNIGAICLFQGSPAKQAGMINEFQKIARTPIMVCIDAEWGVGQRFLDSVMPLPKQMMLGAMKEPSLMLQYGKLVAEQCKRTGIHVNYAPVADVNNNPLNPVINDRSFGEDKYKVASFALNYVKGMQDNDVMACAKHFPGHGDVIADSHYDLPVINKTLSQLDSLELYPFKVLFNAGVESAMMAHLFIPSIESRTNMATSLSANSVTKLLRDKMRFEGLTFTDALDMQAVQKFFPEGESSVESLIAGNDMLCLPADVPQSISKINKAISDGRLSWNDIEFHCKKVLMAKYHYVINNIKAVDTANIVSDLNRGVYEMRKLVAQNAITLVSKNDSVFFPLTRSMQNDIAYVGIGLKADNSFSKRLKDELNAFVYFSDLSPADTAWVDRLANEVLQKHNKIVIGIHTINRRPAKNFEIGNNALRLIEKLKGKPNILFLFGNAYAASNWCNARNLVVCYEDDDVVHQVAADMLKGSLPYKGTLPVTVCDSFKFGHGIAYNSIPDIFYRIDSIAYDAIARKAMPGAVLLVKKDGKTIYKRAYGNHTYAEENPMTDSTVFDLASLTKIFATTLSVMKLYEEGKIDLDHTVSNYLKNLTGTNKENLAIKDLLLHEAGLLASISFHHKTVDKDGRPLPELYSSSKNSVFSLPVADSMYLRHDWPECMMEMIAASPVGRRKYTYSDNDFILLGKLVEKVSGLSLDKYAEQNFYQPMGLRSIGFQPLNKISPEKIAPTEYETKFRSQLIHGTVHDPGAALFGGVAGHAGLFSNASDLAELLQMLLNGGIYKGQTFLKKSTIEKFTTYSSDLSRRGLGFDKPEKDNADRPEAYPSAFASPSTFGHTGFTGTAAWADPENNMIFILLSNRVFPNGSTAFNRLNVRLKMHDEAYRVLSK